MNRAVQDIASAFQNATASEIAGVTVSSNAPAPARRGRPPVSAKASPTPKPGRKPRVASTITRAALNEKIWKAIVESPAPVGLGAISKTLGINATQVAPGIRTLKVEGKIQKHGDKRSATYSPAGAVVTDPTKVLEHAVERATSYDHTPPGEEDPPNGDPATTTNRYVTRRKKSEEATG